jgi:hypothetical protein
MLNVAEIDDAKVSWRASLVTREPASTVSAASVACPNGCSCSVSLPIPIGPRGVTHSTVQHLLVRNLVERDQAGHLALTDQGRAVLAALLKQNGAA